MRPTGVRALLIAALTAAGTLAKVPSATAVPPPLLSDSEVGAQARPDLGWAGRTPTGQIHVAQTSAANDANPGTPSAPVRTIGRGLALVQPGQAVVVHAGTYQERLRTGKDGTATQPIWIQRAAGESRPVLLGSTSTGTSPLLRMNRPYWVVRGLVLNAGGAAANAVRVENTSSVLVDDVEAYGGTAPVGIAFVNAKHSAVRNSRIHEFSRGTEDSHGVGIFSDSSDILVSGNDSWGNSGDSVQCAGPRETGFGTLDPTDVTIENNRYGNRHKNGTARPADRENAVDIKSCQRVTIRGNKMMGYRSAPSSPQGTALVAHYHADAVLIENNRIWDSNSAASLGSEINTGLGSVVFRRNLVFNLVHSGSSKGAFGVRVAPARVAEIYHNTLYAIPVDVAPTSANYALSVGHEAVVQRAVVINNIVDLAGRGLRVGTVTALTVDRNLFYRTASDVPPGSLTGNPMWRPDPVNNDFYTRDASPARDVAISTGSSYCGAGPDLGFLETCTPDSPSGTSSRPTRSATTGQHRAGHRSST